MIEPPPRTNLARGHGDAARMNWMWLEEAARFAAETRPVAPRSSPASARRLLRTAAVQRDFGPLRRRVANGLALRRGYKVASWGDTDQVDFTFSAAKSY